MSLWWVLGIYLIVSLAAGIAYVRLGRTGVSYTDRRFYAGDVAFFLLSPLLFPVALIKYLVDTGLVFLGRIVSSIPYDKRDR